MNIRLILFSGFVTSILGCILGIAAAEIGRSGYYKNAHTRYAGIGVVMGLAIGAAQESIRQLKTQTEREEL